MTEAFDSDGLQRLRAQYQQPASRYLDLGNVEVHLIDEGGEAGQPMVLLLSAQWLAATAYDQFAAGLRGAARVVRLDLPGHGLTGPFADGDYSAHGYARLVAAVIARLGPDRVVLLGHSHSGIAAALVAAEMQTRLAGLVLATSSGMPRDHPAAGPAAAMDDGPHDLGWYRGKLDVLLRLPHPAAWLERLAVETRDCNELPGRAAEARARARAFDASVLPATLPRLTSPGLVLWSAHSTYLPPETGDRIASLWPAGGPCRVVPGSGHLLVADAQAEMAAAITGFLAGRQARGPRVDDIFIGGRC
jgi:pimeloyl-ACP methyl ester carboxylesterase